MRPGLLAFGVVLLVVGGMLFMIGSNGVQEYQTSLGQLGRYLSQSRQEEYLIFMLMETVGGILVLTGFVLSIAGAVAGGAKEKTKEDTPKGVIADELKKLAELHDQGVLTDEEFAEQKKRLLRSK